MLDLFRDVVTGKNQDYAIKDTMKLEALARELGIEMVYQDLSVCDTINVAKNFLQIKCCIK